jgi:tetratricopeptide (TPR) repeat protein
MQLTKRDLGLLAVLIYFTFVGGTFYSQFNVYIRLAHQGVVTLLLGLWLVKRLRRGQGLPPTALDLGLAAYLLANLISAGWGQSPRFSFEVAWFSLTHLLAFYLLVDLLRRGRLVSLLWAFFMTAAVVCLVGLAEFAAWYFGSTLFPGFGQGWWSIGGWQNPIPPVIYRLAITLNGPTPLSAYLALFTPIALSLILTFPRPDENRRALHIWLILAMAVQILTFSRAGVLALVISLGLLSWGWYRLRHEPGADGPPVLWRGLRPAWRLGLLVALGLGAAGLLFWLQSSFSGREASTGFRLTLWQTALTIFQQEWLSGAGPGNFGRALLRLNEAALPRKQIATAHSIYFNSAAELGLIGLLAGAYLLLRLAQTWRHGWQTRPAGDRAGRLTWLAAGAALLGLAGQTLVDTYMATPNMLVMLALLAYISAATVPPARPAWLRQGPAYAALLLLLLYGLGFIWLGRADLHFRQSFRRENLGDLAGAIAAVKQAQTLDPALPLYHFRLGLLEARQAQQSGDPAAARSAINHYQRGLQQEPIWGVNSANLAGLLWQQGRRTEAIAMMQQTIAAEAAPLYLVNLGYFYEQEGAWPAAEAAYGRALALEPGLAGSEFWTARPERARRWPALLAAAEQAGSPAQTRLLLALARADYAAVEALLKAPSLPLADELARRAMAQRYLEAGQAAVAQPWLPPTPQSAADFLLWGRFEQQRGQLDRASTAFKTAVFLGEPRANFCLGQIYEAQGDLVGAERAYQAGFSPRFTSEDIEATIYGRLSGNDLAPQLLRIGVGPAEAAAWLALAGLYERQGRPDEAGHIYRLLLAEDPFLSAAQAGLARLGGG